MLETVPCRKRKCEEINVHVDYYLRGNGKMGADVIFVCKKDSFIKDVLKLSYYTLSYFLFVLTMTQMSDENDYKLLCTVEGLSWEDVKRKVDWLIGRVKEDVYENMLSHYKDCDFKPEKNDTYLFSFRIRNNGMERIKVDVNYEYKEIYFSNFSVKVPAAWIYYTIYDAKKLACVVDFLDGGSDYEEFYRGEMEIEEFIVANSWKRLKEIVNVCLQERRKQIQEIIDENINRKIKEPIKDKSFSYRLKDAKIIVNWEYVKDRLHGWRGKVSVYHCFNMRTFKKLCETGGIKIYNPVDYKRLSIHKTTYKKEKAFLYEKEVAKPTYGEIREEMAKIIREQKAVLRNALNLEKLMLDKPAEELRTLIFEI